MFDAVALGELLIDFTPAGQSEQNAALFARNAGGAPANVLAMMSILGKKTAFIGKVGRDSFGRFLKNTLAEKGICASNVIETTQAPTTVAFVTLDETGERGFSFYRRHSADTMLTRREISRQLLESCRLFHYGSVSMTDEPSREATLYAAQTARRLGKIVSYDPNFRPALWSDRREALAVMRAGLAYADIIKVSDEELEFLTGTGNVCEGAKPLLENGAAIVVVTAGAKGSWYATATGCSGHVDAFPVAAMDTTGAGDAFFGALLNCLLDRAENLAGITDEEMRACVRFANAAGALSTTKPGAIPSLPSGEQIQELLKSEAK